MLKFLFQHSQAQTSPKLEGLSHHNYPSIHPFICYTEYQPSGIEGTAPLMQPYLTPVKTEAKLVLHLHTDTVLYISVLQWYQYEIGRIFGINTVHSLVVVISFYLLNMYAFAPDCLDKVITDIFVVFSSANFFLIFLMLTSGKLLVTKPNAK